MTSQLHDMKSDQDLQIDLSILIVSHGHGELVRQCLESLQGGALQGLAHEIIVTDNRNEGGFLDQIGGPRPGLVVQSNDKPMGFGANMNQAAGRARGRILLLLNPDTAFHEGSIAEAIAWLEADTARGVVAARLLNADLTEQRNFRHFPTMAVTLARGLRADGWRWRPRFYRKSLLEDTVQDGPTRVDWVYGSFILIRASTFRALGGFDEGYFMYYEDVDLCLRLARSGVGCFVYPELSFVHHHQRDSAQTGKNPLRKHHIQSFLRYLKRSHAYFWPPQPCDQGIDMPKGAAITLVPQLVLVALILVATNLAAMVSGAVFGHPITEFSPISFAVCLLLAQFMLQEFDPARMGDVPKRVIGVIESAIMGLFPWFLILVFSSTMAPALALGCFVVLAIGFSALVTYALSRIIPSPGARIGVVLSQHGPGLAGGLPNLPIGTVSVVTATVLSAGDESLAAEALSEQVKNNRIDHILIVTDPDDPASVLKLFWRLAIFDVPVWHSIRDAKTGLPGRVVMLRGPLRSRAREGMKRGVDLIVSLASLLALALPMAFVAVLIKLDDGGPVFFAQPRVGRNQVLFPMLKFRSMNTASADKRGDRLTIKDDPRITRLGRFLRRTSLDELPQLFNVVAGQMSIVGPRPLPDHFHYKGLAFEDTLAEWHYRVRVRPGITGLSQLKGLRGTPDNRSEAIEMMTNRVLFDNLYIDHWTIWLDLRIMAMTVLSGAFLSGN
ncbi:sugar transferase [Pseudorhodobacter sp.]|uniref:sugar transferase n=1 Tax=Pseudorhodobacter sp. TaxID=1934400 RepID=UPI002648C1F4|nr:sugar transferase [Pseudorhodobacter sp.]MDN5785910.1 sugar transferase [Pseudorhodobacter sp.]